MKLHTAALITADLPDMMIAARRPELHSIWMIALAKLKEPDNSCGGIRFRPRAESFDWCVARKGMVIRMIKPGKDSPLFQKEGLYLARLNGTLDVLDRHPVLCKLDEGFWDNPFGPPDADWGGFSWENRYYVGSYDPWKEMTDGAF